MAEEVGRKRLAILTALKERLLTLDTEATVLYAVGHARHDGAQVDYDDLSSIIARLEKDPPVAALLLSDAEKRLVTAETEVKEARDAVTALKTP